MQKCSTCRFYQYHSHAEDECRKNAPVVLQDSDGNTAFPVNCWPKVKHNDFCGQYEPSDKQRVKLITGDAA